MLPLPVQLLLALYNSMPKISEEEWTPNPAQGLNLCCQSAPPPGPPGPTFVGEVRVAHRGRLRSTGTAPCPTGAGFPAACAGSTSCGTISNASGLPLPGANPVNGTYGLDYYYKNTQPGGVSSRCNVSYAKSGTCVGGPPQMDTTKPASVLVPAGFLAPPALKPSIIPPEWVRPDLIPEIIPPTAPLPDVITRPKWEEMPGTRTPANPWADPWYGTDRGPIFLPEPHIDFGYDDIHWPQVETSPGVFTPPLVPKPGGQPVTDPAPGTVPRPSPGVTPSPIRPGPLPLPRPRVATIPIVAKAPGVEVRIDPPGWSPQRLKPPGPRMKERKLIVALPPGALKRIIGGVTEGVDMVGCLHKALPPSKQAQKRRGPDGKLKQPSMKRQAAAVYRSLNTIDGQQIVNSILHCGYEQLMDRAYATIGREAGKAGRRLGRPTGFGIGGNAMRDVTNIYR